VALGEQACSTRKKCIGNVDKDNYAKYCNKQRISKKLGWGTKWCCYMAYNLPRFNALFFQLFIFKRSIFHQFPYFNGRYFQCDFTVIQLLFLNYMRGEPCCVILYAWMPGQHNRFALPAGLCLSYCLTQVYHILNQKLLFLLYTFTLKQLYNCTVCTDSWNIKLLKYGYTMFKMVKPLDMEILKAECRVAAL
jgi:hypothetical protein